MESHTECNNHLLIRGREEVDALIVPEESNNQLKCYVNFMCLEVRTRHSISMHIPYCASRQGGGERRMEKVTVRTAMEMRLLCRR
eukprot:scaffold40286_cov32-Cyclotella_meneghiniana.AAC.1